MRAQLLLERELTNLISGIAILCDSISADDNCVDIVMLE
jgi:hypothetical protein